MKEILIITGNWTIGGAEKVIKNIAENLPKEKYKINLLIFRKINCGINNKKQPIFNYSKNTNIYYLERKNLFSLYFSLFSFLRKNKPDLILTVIDPFFASLIAAIEKIVFKKSKIIISFHNFFPSKGKTIKQILSFSIRNFFIKKANFIITVSKDLEGYVKKNINISSSKIETVYNPIINQNEILKSKYFPKEFLSFKENIKILTVSRLDIKQKDFYTLIDAFILIKQKINSAKLFIVGDGPDRNKLEDLIRKNNLEKDVILLGTKENPYPYYFGADIFLLSSFFEGLPTVVVEAMALECPVVATDCPTGPRELIGNNKNGILVPMQNTEKMAEAVILLIANKKLRQKIIKNAKRKSEEFEIKKSIQKYENLFDKLLN